MLRSSTRALAASASRRAYSKLMLYSAPGTPSPDTVHMYLEEAQATDMVTVEKVQIGKAQNRGADFVRLNPMGEVPALALGDGTTVLTESLVICRYLEDFRTGGAGSPLYGTSPIQRAETDMWYARAESKFLTPLMWAVRCGPLAKFFKDRTPGYIHPEVAEPMGVAAQAGLGWLEAQLADGRPFLCGERFTIADIRLYVNYAFLTKTHKPMAAQPAEHAAFLKWFTRVAARPSAAAIAKPKK
eukprot:992749-Prymnesium_polylepis.1